MHPNAQTIRNLYDAFDNADLETIQNALADDVTLELAGRSALAGTYKGKDEVLGLLGEFISRSEGTFKIAVHDVIANDEHVVVLNQVTAQRGDKSLADRGVEVFHLKDGKITGGFFTGMDLYDFDEFFS